MSRSEDFCGQCGRSGSDGDHTACVRRAELEPPRFCAQCGRRMKVQVVPRGWTAVCVEHGEIHRGA